MPEALQPADPHFAERVRESFARQSFMAHLGARLAKVEPGLVGIELDYRETLLQQHGFFHAGVSSSIADSAGGYAGYTLFPAGSSVLTVEFKINLLAPARGERLLATGRVVRAGRTLTVCELRVEAIRDGHANLCVMGTQTLICLHDRADKPAPSG